MKSLILSIILIGIVPFIAQAQVTDQLIACYPFSGDVEDHCGEDDLIIYGSPQPADDRFGNSDCAYRFNGNNTDYLRNSDNLFALNVDQGWSVSLWYRGGSARLGDFETLFYHGNANRGTVFTNECNSLNLYDGNRPMSIAMKDSINARNFNSIWAEDDRIYEDSTIWHHMVLTVNPAEDTMLLYVDNVSQASYPYFSFSFIPCEASFYIGINFQGVLDDIYYYHKPLSPDEVNELFEMQSSCIGVVQTEAIVKTEMGLSVFPNPTENGVINISSNKEIIRYSIYNSIGVWTQAGLYMDEEIKLNTGPGIYSILLEDIDGIKYTERIIVRD